MSVIGYDYNDGGISNQKIALLGLILAAISGSPSERPRIYMPRIYSRDQHDKISSFALFGDVFWADMFDAFLVRWNIETVPVPDVIYKDRIERGGWDFFSKGCACLSGVLENVKAFRADIAADFFRSLMPKIASHKIFNDVAADIFVRRQINTVSQLRIEEDWQNYSKITLPVHAASDDEYILSAEEIIAKVKNTLPDIGNEVFVLCDERYLLAPTFEIRETVKNKTGVTIVWKSDILSDADYQSLTPLDASLLDFELGTRADNFVGLSWSTFSNLMAFERSIRMFRRHTNDFIYNHPGPLLGRRTDLGSRLNPAQVCDAAFDPDTVWSGV